MTQFGKLEAVAIQEGWPGEAHDFTPWLAEKDNLDGLGKELELEIELVEKESHVGSFRADILARHVGTGELIVIENQYYRTDHTHLGQLLTYAAGVGQEGSGAKTIIWIAESFTEPHRAALDWLNKCTEPGIRFFGVELQLWRIGTSAPAPRFQVVSRPNDWQKKLTQKTSAPSAIYDLYQDFWNDFIADCADTTAFELSKAPARHWVTVRTIRRGFTINLTVSKNYKEMTVQLWIDCKDAKSAFDSLLQERDTIIGTLGPNLEFDRKEGKNPCSIFESRPCNITDRAEWPAMQAWLKERAEVYVNVFTPLVKALP